MFGRFRSLSNKKNLEKEHLYLFSWVYCTLAKLNSTGVFLFIQIMELVRNGKYSSLYLVEQINVFRELEGSRATLMHYDFLKKIEREFEDEIADGNISVSYYKDKSNKQSKHYELDYEQSFQILMSESKIVRRSVIEKLKSFQDKKDSGELLSQSEVLHLIDLVKCCFVEEFRKLAKQKHLGLYLPKYKTRESHIEANETRNKICQIDFEQIKKRLSLISAKRPQSKEAGLIQIDKYELIRIAVIDCMLSFGKSESVAKNLGKFAKELAAKQDGHFTRENTMYGLPKEYEAIYLQLNK